MSLSMFWGCEPPSTDAERDDARLSAGEVSGEVSGADSGGSLDDQGRARSGAEVSSGGDSSGEESSGEELSGEELSGEESSGEELSGGESGGEESSGEESPPELELPCAALGSLEVEWDAVTGAPALIWGEALAEVTRRCADGLAEDAAPREVAEALLSKLQKIYRAGGDLELIDQRELSGQRTLVRFRQVARLGESRAVVFGGVLTVHLNALNQPSHVSGRYWPLTELPMLEPTPSRESLVTLAERFGEAHLNAQVSLVGEPSLTILPHGVSPRIGYILIVSEGEQLRSWRLFVEQGSDSVELIEPLSYDGFPEIGQSVMISGALNENEGGEVVSLGGWQNVSDQRYYLSNDQELWRVYAVNETCTQFAECVSHSEADWGAHDTVSITAAHHMSQTLTYLRERFDRVGWDGEGGVGIAITRYPCHQPNAFYLGSGQIALGAFEGVPLVTRDIIAHELFHGVTRSGADLVYSGESGAINESFSDIFAALVGASLTPDLMSSELDWVIGDVALPGYAQRDLSDPASDESPRPSRYRGANWGDPTSEIDNGWVHTNSSVQSYFFYLLVTGGTGVNDGIPYELESVPLRDAETLAYRALNEFAHPTSAHDDIRLAWLAAARALDDERGVAYDLGLTARVDEAWGAVGVGEPPCVTGYRDADLDGFGDPSVTSEECAPPAGYVINALDCDDLNAARALGAPEVCGDGVINDCSLSAEEACGELSIAGAPAGQLRLTWRSDCVLQVTEDGVEWRDHEQQPQRVECDAELSVTPTAPSALFRLRLP